ncbi:MAG: hypothetical protein J6W37_06195 [Bacteroidales bacterium]|nr:hypothetical protein [Bacteroidales bacterium]
MKRFILLLILGLSITTVFAQRDNQKWYLNGFGGRLELGASSNNLMGIDLSHFFRPKFDVNAFFISNWDFTTSGIYLGGVLAKYVSPYPNISSRLRWYAGVGLQGAGQPIYEVDGVTKTGDTQITFGPTAVLGTGYSFQAIPINICVEWRPSWDVVYTHFNPNAPNSERMQVAVFGFVIRYITGNKYKG